MNILHMKYAVEVAKAGSINKAAESLFVAQPNLSRSIKELEADLGISIFNRSSKGMTLTPEGEVFIGYAKKVLNQIDDIERMYRSGAPKTQRFSISVPRASYISDAFAQFTKCIDGNPAEIHYMETNSATAVNNIMEFDYHLGIIRYEESFEKYFRDMLEEKNLTYDLVAEFRYVLIMSNESPLAQKKEISFADLRPMLELCHGDPYVPSLPLNVAMQENHLDDTDRHVYLFERGGQFDVLMENPETFMWVSPLPEKLLTRYNLAQRPCVDNRKIFKDVLIRKKDYVLTELDNRFITELIASKRRCLPQAYNF